MVSSGVFSTPLPVTASHEGAGTVLAAGPSVDPEAFPPGTRVMCGLYRNCCGVCPDCAHPSGDWAQYCLNSGGAIGVHRHGCFAQYVVADSRQTAKLPDNIPFTTAAPLACAGCTVFRAILQADMREHSGEWLAIVGAGGGLGHLGIQFAKAMGINVVAVDARDSALQLARDCGADVVLDARDGTPALVSAVHSVTAGEGAKATLNLSDADSAAATACAVTRLHGRMVQVAQPPQVAVPFEELIFRDIRVQGSLICSPGEARRMLEVVSRAGVQVRKHVVRGLEAVPGLVELGHWGGGLVGKGVVVVDAAQINVGA